MEKSSDDDRKHALAARLTALCDGQLKIKFSPETFRNCDKDGYDENEGPSAGHVWLMDRATAADDDGPESDTLSFDDRDGPAPDSAVAELRRVGNLYSRLASQLEEAIATGQPIPPVEGQFAIIVVKHPVSWDHCNGWDDAPTEYEPVAMFHKNTVFGAYALHDDDMRDFNRMSFFNHGGLWMMRIPAMEARKLTLPSWESIKDSQPCDYNDSDIIAWEGNTSRKWLAAVIEGIRNLKSDKVVGGVPLPLWLECFVRLTDGHYFDEDVVEDLPLSAVDFATGELIVTPEERRHSRRDDKRIRRYRFDAEDTGADTLEALKRLIAAGDERKTLFPALSYREMCETMEPILADVNARLGSKIDE